MSAGTRTVVTSSMRVVVCFFFNDTATTEIYTLSLHDALPISAAHAPSTTRGHGVCHGSTSMRSEEHTSELQSRLHLVCRLLLEKKQNRQRRHSASPPRLHQRPSRAGRARA